MGGPPTLRPHLKSFKDWIRQIFFGICIGAADIVPGVSGGTMALILGIYEDLIFAVKSLGTKDVLFVFLLKFKRFHQRVCWDFILALLFGIALSLATLSQTIHSILGHEVYRVYLFSLFVGMILSSVVFCLKHIKDWSPELWWAVGVGAVVTFLLTGTRTEPVVNGPVFDVKVPKELISGSDQRQIKNYDPEVGILFGVSRSTLSAMYAKGYITSSTQVYHHGLEEAGTVEEFVVPEKPGWINFWLITCGAIVISAMLLPGISGSYLLTILGAYPLAIAALADFVRGFPAFDNEAFTVLANLGIGIVIGALIFSRIIGWLLKHYHAITLAALVGFMVGALRTVWPFWSYYYLVDPLRLDKGPQLHVFEPYLPSIWSASTWYAMYVGVLGFVLVLVLERVAKGKPTKQI